jgi:tRNA-2-methylthio-N6-dimethylallyladenosine synthase
LFNNQRQRPNTEASEWSNQVSEEIKQERLQIVQRLAVQHATERSYRYKNTVVEVLVEERNPKNMNQVMGRTRQGRLVFFDGNIQDLLGALVNVEITETRPWSLSGKMKSIIR